MQIDDIKNYIYYGNNDGKGQLDYAIISMFNLLEEKTVFDRKSVESLFWERIANLINKNSGI